MIKLLKKAALMLGAVLLATSIPVSTQAKPKELSKSIKAGDSVYFGKYEQDGNTKNGKEKIEWQVLDKKDGKALLVSKKVLDAQPYNKEWKGITWEKCTLRKWLNNDFIKEAFNAKESKKIQKSKIKNKDNKEYGTKGGKDTTDKVFLLSIDEANKYYKTDEKRTAEITDYGIKRIAKVLDRTEKDLKKDSEWFGESNNMWYWLRSPGFDQLCAAYVDFVGSVSEDGNFVSLDYLGVRPALWVNL